jgi:hypothetical protein
MEFFQKIFLSSFFLLLFISFSYCVKTLKKSQDRDYQRFSKEWRQIEKNFRSSVFQNWLDASLFFIKKKGPHHN